MSRSPIISKSSPRGVTGPSRRGRNFKKRYAGKVEFDWKIAQMPAEAYPTSKEQAEWFYRRSGTIVKSPFMLNAGWFEAGLRKIYDVPNLDRGSGEGFRGDGRSGAIGARSCRRSRRQKRSGAGRLRSRLRANAARLNKTKLLARAKSAAVAARVKKVHGRISSAPSVATTDVFDRECHRRSRGVLRDRARRAVGGGNGRIARGSGGLRFLPGALWPSARELNVPN
jgi:hypothetical protein